MNWWRALFPVALAIALVALLPLRVVMGLAGGPIAARSVEGSVWSGTLKQASLGGEQLGDLDAGLSFFSLFLGKARVRVDGPLLHGAIVATLSSSGIDIETLTLPLSRAIGPVRLASLDANGAHVRYRGRDCSEGEGRVGLTIRSFLGEHNISGNLRCSGRALAVDLVSQSAMQRLSVRFPDSSHYEAVLIMRTANSAEAAGLAAAGFRETPVGHVKKFSGTF